MTRQALVTTLGITSAALAALLAVWQFADGEPVFGVIWGVLAVGWFVYATMLSRAR